MRGRLLLLASAIALGACAGARGRADDALARGDFAGAVELYEGVVARDPEDQEARDRLAFARGRALAVLLAAVDDDRRAGRVDAALDHLREALATRTRWAYRAPADVAARTAAEVAWATEVVRREVTSLAAAPLPLHAEEQLRRRGAQLAQPELGGLGQSLTAVVIDAGASSCARVRERATTPYLARLVAAYCAHFRAPAPATPPLPHAASVVEVSGAVEGATAAQIERMRRGLDAAFRRTIWYLPDAPRRAVFTLGGAQRARFSSHGVTVSRPWTERIPYEDVETYQEPYQEPYTDVEHTTEQVAYTDYETVYVPCGSGRSSSTCPQSRPVTRYRSEPRSRTVTKYRTAYRPRQRVVTKIREVPRVFTFEAVEHVGEYESAVVVQLDAGPGLIPFAVRTSGHVREAELEHDVAFPAAGVAPAHTPLTTADAWLDRRFGALERELPGAAAEHYRTLFCKAPAYDAEDAARCAHARAPSYPAAVRAGLVPLFGADAELLLALER